MVISILPALRAFSTSAPADPVRSYALRVRRSNKSIGFSCKNVLYNVRTILLKKAEDSIQPLKSQAQVKNAALIRARATRNHAVMHASVQAPVHTDWIMQRRAACAIGRSAKKQGGRDE